MMPIVRFFSFETRTGRRGLAVWLIVFCTLAWGAAVVLTRAEGMLPVFVYALLGLAAAKLATETVRRVHDIGQSGWIGVGVCFGVVILVATAILHWLGYGADLPFWSLIALATVAVATLLLRPGEPNHNRHGPPPGASATGTARPSLAGTVAATIWMIAGISCGFMALSWQEGMDRQREQRISIPEPPPKPLRSTAPARTGPDVENDALSNRIDDLLTTGNAG
jgi:uncharacterized membrane protein YhaH (DUF805 family)